MKYEHDFFYPENPLIVILASNISSGISHILNLLAKKKCIYSLFLYFFLTFICLFIPYLILGLAMVILLNRQSVSIS